MADHAPNFTARYRLKYNDGLANHTQTWRYPGTGDGPELTAVSAAVGSYYTEMAGGLWNDFTVISASYALKDSDIFLPLSTPVVTGAQEPTSRRRFHKAMALSFVGRTNLGKRVIFYQYGFWKAVGEDDDFQDFRITTSEEGVINGAIASLVTAGADLVGNDGAAVNWYPYANIGENDYWKGKVRNG